VVGVSAPPNGTSHVSGTSELTRVGVPRVDESRGDLMRLYERVAHDAAESGARS
jgi:hypothetical protein